MHFFIAASVNQPLLCPSANWTGNASTVLNISTIGNRSYAMFVDINDTVYVASLSTRSVLAWNSSAQVLTRNVTGLSNAAYSIFATSNGDIYADDGASNRTVKKWTRNTTQITLVMNVSDSCYGLFVDGNNNLYCSIQLGHIVIKKTLGNNSNNSVTVAGNGTGMLANHTLKYPQGIFVDNNFTLYVADCSNNRIQVFQQGQLNGTTRVSNGSSVALDCPTGVTLDGNGNMYIVSNSNHRIIRSDLNGNRCLVGCSGSGSSADKLQNPQSMFFDRLGNMFVLDKDNSRVQKFFLTGCSE